MPTPSPVWPLSIPFQASSNFNRPCSRLLRRSLAGSNLHDLRSASGKVEPGRTQPRYGPEASPGRDRRDLRNPITVEALGAAKEQDSAIHASGRDALGVRSQRSHRSAQGWWQDCPHTRRVAARCSGKSARPLSEGPPSARGKFRERDDGKPWTDFRGPRSPGRAETAGTVPAASVTGMAAPAAAQGRRAASAKSDELPVGQRLQGVQHFGLTVQNMERALHLLHRGAEAEPR